MGELEKHMYVLMYETFKINSVLFRDIQVGMTTDENNNEVLFVTEVFDTVAHNVVPRTFRAPMTPENKIAANTLRSLVAIEKAVMSRIPSNVITLDKFGTYSRENVASPQIDLVVGSDMTDFVDSLFESLNTINTLLMPKGTFENTFVTKITGTETMDIVLKQDDRYTRHLKYQGLDLEIVPEMFQLQISAFLNNLLLTVEFNVNGGSTPITVVQVPIRFTVHNIIQKIAGMNSTKTGIINAKFRYEALLDRIVNYYYDTVNRSTDYEVAPATPESNKTFVELFRDPKVGATVNGTITVKCINSSIPQENSVFAMANIYAEDGTIIERCKDAISVTEQVKVDGGLEYTVSLDATKITTTAIQEATVEINTGYRSDNSKFIDSLTIPVKVNLTEFVEPTPEEPPVVPTKKARK